MTPTVPAALLLAGLCAAPAQDVPDFLAGRFRWRTGPPVLAPAERPGDPCHAIKDPTFVRHEGRWHLFTSIRSKVRSHQIEYASFEDWKDAHAAKRHVLAVSDGYFCAPQVFYFRAHKKWYLIQQVTDPARKPALQPACSTTADIADPASWSKPVLLFREPPTNVERWLDFWVICDEEKARLFYTSLDGRMWRADARLEDFPHGWGTPQVVLKGDVFEASHTYRLKGMDKYLTLIEAQDGGRRYYKAYLADRLDAEWKELAASRENPFASPRNVEHAGERWTDSYSHGELFRDGVDERLEVDPANLRFLYQGVSDEARKGKKYGDIPWRLGILEPAK